MQQVRSAGFSDTQRHAIAEAVVVGGATIINDISGGADSRLFDIAAKYGTSLIILPRDSNKVADPIASIITSHEEDLDATVEVGIESSMILVDPGIGFFRNSIVSWYERGCTRPCQAKRSQAIG